MTAPRDAIYGLKGQWEVENHGVAPDIEVDDGPELVREGHDPQLKEAVDTVMEMLKEHPLPEYPRPAYPDYHPLNPCPCPEGGACGASVAQTSAVEVCGSSLRLTFPCPREDRRHRDMRFPLRKGPSGKLCRG